MYSAYEQPGHFFLPATALDVVVLAGGDPAFKLNLFLQDRGNQGLAQFGLLDIRFAVRFDLAEVHQAVFAELPDVRLSGLLPEFGLIRLSAPAALELPEEMTAVQPLDVGGVGSLAMTLRLGATAAELFLGALRQGLATVLADAWIVCRGVAARYGRTVRFDPKALHDVLLGTFNDDQIAVEALRERLRTAPEFLPITLSAPVIADDAEGFADAFADRLIGEFADVAASPINGSGAWVRFDAVKVRSGEVRWDLSEPMLVPRIFSLQADPLGSARAMTGAEAETLLVHSIDVPAMQSGWRTLSISPNIPERQVGVLRTIIEITVPPNPPARPQTLKSTVILEPGKRAHTLDLRLAPGEPLNFQWRTQVFAQSGGAVQSFAGPLRRHDREHLTVNPDAFAVRFISVAAEASFLAEADISVECSGVRGDHPWVIKGLLDEAQPTLAFVIPAQVTDAVISATAKSRATGLEKRMAPCPAQALWLDPFCFEGSGARSLEIRCDFDDVAAEVWIECVAEDRVDDTTRRARIRLTPEFPRQQWTWLALSPFHSGFRWRWLMPDGSSAIEWSNILQPDTSLILQSSQRFSTTSNGSQPMHQSLIIDGVELTPVAEHPNTYRYKPLAATVARDDSGRAQFTLIKAGPIAMLSCTTQWGMPGPALETVREKLATQLRLSAPSQITLVPAGVAVGPVELLIGDGSGTFSTLLTNQSSGMPPYHTAFNATLTEAQCTAVEKAVVGKHGFLAVRYSVTESTAAASTTQTLRQSSSFSTTTVTRVSDAGTSTMQETSAATDSIHSNGSPQTLEAVPKIYLADAADWGLGA